MPVKTGIFFEINQIFNIVYGIKIIPVNEFSKYKRLFINDTF